MKTLILLILILVPACVAQVGTDSGTPTETTCDPSLPGVRMMGTPDSVTEIGPELEREWGVTGCEEVPTEHGLGRTWCCWKSEVSR